GRRVCFDRRLPGPSDQHRGHLPRQGAGHLDSSAGLPRPDLPDEHLRAACAKGPLHQTGGSHHDSTRPFPTFLFENLGRPCAGIYETGTSPSCLALNTSGTRLYSANETDRVGEDKHGTVSAFAIQRADGKLTLLNSVRSGGAGPTFVSVHPSGRFLLVANYFG